MTDSPSIAHLTAADHAAVLEIYNHYVVASPATFDTVPFTLATRQPWFEQFGRGAHVCLVATGPDGTVLGYTNSAPFKPKPAYHPSVEVSIYVHPDHQGQGLGRALYGALFEHLAGQPVHRLYGGISQPNEASVALHTALGFREVGRFSEVGYKFDRFWDVAWFERANKGAV